MKISNVFKAKKWINIFLKSKFSRVLSDACYLKLKYYVLMGKKLNLKDPKTYSEKLQWLKLNFRDSKQITMVDKFASKTFVADTIGEKYVVPVLGGPWKKFSDINFDELPNQFVLKTNHDCGGVVICKDKSNFDIKNAKRILTKHLKRKYYWHAREWPYKNVNPVIFAEKYIEDNSGDAIYDYKFFCFNGLPRIMYMSRDKSATPYTDFFDMDFNLLNMKMRDPNSDVPPNKPEHFEEMKQLASKMAEGFPHVRVDFYQVGNVVNVGELTFYHCGGFINITPTKWNEILGSWIELPTKNVH